MPGPPDRLRLPTPAERAASAGAVRAHLPPTPLVPARLDGEVWLKLETLQPTGSFKVRGGVAALTSLAEGTEAVSASAGNHALGMAFAARRIGRAVTVVTAETASPAKLAAIEALAAGPGPAVTLVRHGPDYDAAEAHARHLAAGPGRAYVSGYSDWAVIAGAATIGDELPPALAAGCTVVTPLGGGGLTSGLLLWAAEGPGRRIVAAQAAASPAAGRSARAGHNVEVEVGATLADGLAGNLEAGTPTVALLHAGLDAGRLQIVDVDEAGLRAAIRWAFTTTGAVVEGAGAAAIAAVLAARPAGPTVVLCTGRNISPETYASVLSA